MQILLTAPKPPQQPPQRHICGKEYIYIIKPLKAYNRHYNAIYEQHKPCKNYAQKKVLNLEHQHQGQSKSLLRSGTATGEERHANYGKIIQGINGYVK